MTIVTCIFRFQMSSSRYLYLPLESTTLIILNIIIIIKCKMMLLCVLNFQNTLTNFLPTYTVWGLEIKEKS